MLNNLGEKKNNNDDGTYLYIYIITAPNGRNVDAQHINYHLLHARAVTRVIEFPGADEQRETKPIRNHNLCTAELRRRARTRSNPPELEGTGTQSELLR